MSETPTPAPKEPMSRAEKLSVLSALLGPDALARVRDAQPSAEMSGPTVVVDADRAAWHRNKLLERLRKSGPASSQKEQVAGTELTSRAAAHNGNTSPQTALAASGRSLDMRLAKMSDGANLAQEHPAVIARLIKTLSRNDRVDALKSLPGPVARSIVRRIK